MSVQYPNQELLPTLTDPDLQGLAKDLSGVFEQSHSIESLNQLLLVLEEAESRQAEHIVPELCGTIALYLSNRFELIKSADDLDRAIRYATRAKDATPEHDTYLYNRHIGIFGNLLGQRYLQAGNVADLEEAIRLSSLVVDNLRFIPKRCFPFLNNLAVSLYDRYLQSTSMDDLNRMIEIAREVETFARQDQDLPSHPACLQNLAGCLFLRFERTKSKNDIDEAVSFATAARDALPPDKPDAVVLSTLAACLAKRYEVFGSTEDIESAISACETGLRHTPLEDPNRDVLMVNVQTMLCARFELSKRLGPKADLDTAISYGNQAIKELSPMDPNLAMYMLLLGESLHRRFEVNGTTADCDEALSWYQQGWRKGGSSPAIRVRLARRIAQVFGARKAWASAARFLRAAVELLPMVSPRSMKHVDKQHRLSKLFGIASMAASAALNAGEEPSSALQLLEQGRGIIAGRLLEVRTDIEILQRKAPELALRFERVRDELDSSVSEALLPAGTRQAQSWEDRARRRPQAEQQFEELLGEIRQLPGFEDFLGSTTVEQLINAASSGPVIVLNTSDYRCDAFLIRNDHPITVLELPELQLEDITEYSKLLRSDLTKVMSWLWRVVARPCLDEIGFSACFSGNDWPHVWWCPTGAMSYFPLHAAGLHYRDSGETVLDRVISSYTPTIKTLLHARRERKQQRESSELGTALLVDMQETTGLARLPFAGQEANIVAHICHSMQLTPVQLPEKCRESVLAHLRKCKIFHFAGHGESNPAEPSKSRLMLQDWQKTPLTVADLRVHWLQENSPFLAYLSACSTGENKEEDLADEAIHLINACQLAGFRHVVGTLWEVDDAYSVDAAVEVYEVLRKHGLGDESVALGVHEATRLLRSLSSGRELGSEYAIRQGGDPILWAAYVHFGP